VRGAGQAGSATVCGPRHAWAPAICWVAAGTDGDVTLCLLAGAWESGALVTLVRVLTTMLEPEGTPTEWKRSAIAFQGVLFAWCAKLVAGAYAWGGLASVWQRLRQRPRGVALAGAGAPRTARGLAE